MQDITLAQIAQALPDGYDTYIPQLELKTGEYNIIPDHIMRRNDISMGAKITWCKLCRYAGRDGRCFPSVSRLANDIGVSSERQVRRYLAELEEARDIVAARRPGKVSFYLFARPAAPDKSSGAEMAPPDNMSGGTTQPRAICPHTPVDMSGVCGQIVSPTPDNLSKEGFINSKKSAKEKSSCGSLPVPAAGTEGEGATAWLTALAAPQHCPRPDPGSLRRLLASRLAVGWSRSALSAAIKLANSEATSSYLGYLSKVEYTRAAELAAAEATRERERSRYQVALSALSALEAQQTQTLSADEPRDVRMARACTRAAKYGPLVLERVRANRQPHPGQAVPERI